VVSGTPALATTATAGSAPGKYPVTADGSPLSAANYTFQAVNGTLTVTPAATATTPVVGDGDGAGDRVAQAHPAGGGQGDGQVGLGLGGAEGGGGVVGVGGAWRRAGDEHVVGHLGGRRGRRG
jgi:hypothetical protein